jgi:hypothetical protein
MGGLMFIGHQNHGLAGLRNVEADAAGIIVPRLRDSPFRAAPLQFAVAQRE